MTYRKLLVASAGVLAALLIAGCAANGAAEPPGQTTAQTYQATDITENGQSKTLEAGTQIRLAFDKDVLTATTGCNTLTGQARFDAERLTVSNLSTTDIACGDPFTRLQQWLTQFLDDHPTWKYDRDTLLLNTSNIRMRLTPAASP